MKCSVCGNAMVLLFTSAACDWCEGKTEVTGLHVGYVVWRGLLGPWFPQYVFENEASAKRWQVLQNVHDGEVRRVLSTESFTWRDGHGDVRFADHLYEVFPDAKFRPAPHRVWLAPEKKS